MANVVEKEIDRAVARIAPAPVLAPPPPRSRPPVVRFSPMFEEPPPSARRGRRLLVAVSIAAHVLLFTVLLLMPKRAQTIEEPALPIEIVLTSPMPEAPRTPPPPKPVEPPKPKPKPQAKEEPPPVVEAPKPLPKPPIREIEPAAPVAKAEPKQPKPEVKVGLLDEAPSGPAIVASKSSKSVIVASGFEGSAGSASSAPRPGRVMEAAFDTAPAGTGKRARAADGAVRESGFGEEAAVAPKKRERERPAGALDSEVEILSKPKPVYTDEARSLKLEGDVVLDVTFTAAGRVVVLGVAQGLGHGLDEAAAVAARKIQFNPARRDGSPVDHTAKLRVVFRLA